MTTCLPQVPATGNRRWHPLRFVRNSSWSFARIVRRRPLRTLVLFVLFLLLVATGLFFWSGARLRAADRACREFHREEAQRLLNLAYPFRSWWDPDAQFLAARLARLRRDGESAEKHLRACQRLEGETSSRIQLEWILLRALRGELEAVEPGLWNSVWNDDPDSAFILEVLAGMKIQALQFTHAMTVLDKWVAIDPNNALAWEWRGWVLMRLDQPDLAEVSLRRSLELEPGRSSAALWLSELYLQQFKVVEAEPLVERLLLERSDLVPVLSAGGQYRFLTGKLDDARRLFDRAYELNPIDQEVLIRRAKLELQSGHPREAELWLGRARSLEEANSEVHYLLHQALTLQPGREKEVAAQLARYQKYKEQAERFGRLMRELIPANPKDPKYAAEFGDILFRTDQPAKALYWHTRALQIDPKYVPSHRALADYYEKVGNPAEAAMHRAYLSQPSPRSVSP